MWVWAVNRPPPPPLRGLNQSYVTFPGDDTVVKGQWGMITGLQVPLELAAALCALCCALGALAGHMRAARRAVSRPNPLADLMQPSQLDPVIDLAARRNAMREAAQAVLHGRVAPETAHDAAHDHVAAVMRAGLRRGDRVTHIAGEGFTIILPGADERAGARIADRLRRSLSQTKLDARFGVAAGATGDGGDLLARRARRELDAAEHGRDAHVVAASDFEEVLFLPAPAASAA